MMTATPVRDMTKKELVETLAATYDNPREWAHYYGSWSKEAIRTQLRKRNEYLASKGC